MDAKSLLCVLTVERGKMFKQRMLRLVPEGGAARARTVRFFYLGTKLVYANQVGDLCIEASLF